MLRLASDGEIDVILATYIDRLGRNAGSNLELFEKLQGEFDVEIVTLDGKVNTDTESGFLKAGVESIIAQFSINKRARKSLESRIEEFRQKNWHSWYHKVPLGYKEIEDCDWIKVDEEEAEVVRDAFRQFLEQDLYGAYTATSDYLEKKYDMEIDGKEIKELLTRPVYAGKPTLSSDSVRTLVGEKVIVEDESLVIVDEDTYEAAQKK
jgi:DNA invertase Pin-like site-specific DNA recombinase